MVFSDLFFLFVFLPAFILLYNLCAWIDRRRTSDPLHPSMIWRNGSLVVFSLLFYAWGEPVYVLLMIVTVALNYLAALWMTGVHRQGWRKLALTTGIAVNLLILCSFKYLGFFARTLNSFGVGVEVPEIALPIGISFYIFQSVSYLVDVYRCEAPAQRRYADLLLYISMFPQLIAGPIVRYDTIAREINDRHVNAEDLSDGVFRFLIGLGKKVILANQFSEIADRFLANGLDSLSTGGAWIGILAFTFQIYFDFSGYSDMAIGMALIMGFRIPDNFNFPYKSTSLTEFWRRWHISLSTWLRDYLYIPLGGNRKGKYRTYINNFITMLLGGLWHGAAWKFIFWGGMHGAGLAINKACRPFTSKFDGKLWFTALSWLITMATVSFLWIFFRADSWADSWSIVCNIFTNFSLDYLAPFAKVRYTWLIMMAVVIITHSFTENFYSKITRIFVSSPWIVKLLIFMLVIQLVIEFAGEDVPPFIYFQF